MEIPKYTYLAAPYSHEDPEVRAERMRCVNKVACGMWKSGQMVYSPLTHNVPFVEIGMKSGWEVWEPFDSYMLSRASRLFVLKLEGWEVSVGVRAELEYAERFGVPVEYGECDLNIS